jgi:hypothetical protein
MELVWYGDTLLMSVLFSEGRMKGLSSAAFPAPATVRAIGAFVATVSAVTSVAAASVTTFGSICGRATQENQGGYREGRY